MFGGFTSQSGSYQIQSYGPPPHYPGSKSSFLLSQEHCSELVNTRKKQIKQYISEFSTYHTVKQLSGESPH